MADRGEFQTLELNEKLQGDAEEGSDQQQRPFAAAEARPFHNGEHADTGEEEAIQNVVADAKTAEGNLPEEEAGPPAASGERAGDVAEAAADHAGVLKAPRMRRELGTLFFHEGRHFAIG